MKEGLWGTTGAALGAIIILMAWLLWPLPTNAFDWQALVDGYVEQGECRDAAEVATGMFGVTRDPDVLATLQELSAGEICPGAENFMSPESLALLVEARDWDTLPLFPEKMSIAGSAAFTFRAWSSLREARQEFDGSLLNWADLVIGVRCSPLYTNFYEIRWRLRRNQINQWVGEPPRVAAWDRRQRECYAVARREFQRLERETPASDRGMRSLYWEYQQRNLNFAP